MRIEINSHAFKHGLTREQILAAFETCFAESRVRARDKEAYPPRAALVGFDPAGRPVELVAVYLANDSVLIIHANWLTKGFLEEIREARK